MPSKRIKSMAVPGVAQLLVAPGAGDVWEFFGRYVNDNIRIVGVEIWATMAYQGPTFAAAPNHGECQVVASLTGTLMTESILAMASATHDLLAAGECYGKLDTGTIVVMFPEGHGIDIDAGQYVYGGVYVSDAFITGGTVSVSGSVIYYYVER